jgi:hypothetical protein
MFPVFGAMEDSGRFETRNCISILVCWVTEGRIEGLKQSGNLPEPRNQIGRFFGKNGRLAPVFTNAIPRVFQILSFLLFFLFSPDPVSKSDGSGGRGAGLARLEAGTSPLPCQIAQDFRRAPAKRTKPPPNPPTAPAPGKY